MAHIKILRITNGGGPTSSPLNTFTLARSHLYPDEETTYLSFYKGFDGDEYVSNHANLEAIKEGNEPRIVFKSAGGSTLRFYREIVKWHHSNRRSGNRLIVHVHNPKRGFLFAPLRKLFKSVTFVYTVHNNYANYSLKNKLFLSVCFRFADQITFVSNDAYESFVSHYIKPDARKTAVIQNGVDVNRIVTVTSKEERRREDNLFSLIAVGRYVPQKNYQFLLDIMGLLDPSFHLDIYGTGGKSQDLLDTIRYLGLSGKVSIKGNVSREDLYQKMSQKDAFISTSLWEGLPVAMMEAMACGLPVVASSIDSHREVGNDASGVILHDYVQSRWIETLNELKAMPPHEILQMGKENHKLIAEKFSLQRMQEEYRDMYERLSTKI